MWRSEIARSAFSEKYRKYSWWVAWPLILLTLFSSCARSCSSPDEATSTTTIEQITTYGATAILAYLVATPSDGKRLEEIFGGELTKPPAGQQGIPLPRRTVLASFANAEPLDDAPKPANWAVTLTAITSEGTESWQMPVRVSGDAYRPTRLPGLVPGLATGPAVSPTSVAAIEVCEKARTAAGTCNESPLASTLRDFFTAWLTGNGDLSRVADTRQVPAFTPAPFTRVQLIEAFAGSQIPQRPDGTLVVGATVWGMNTRTVQLSYTLKLTASAGRWVVSDIATAPPVREEKNPSPNAPAGP